MSYYDFVTPEYAAEPRCWVSIELKVYQHNQLCNDITRIAWLFQDAQTELVQTGQFIPVPVNSYAQIEQEHACTNA